jgi:hypothetical protein
MMIATQPSQFVKTSISVVDGVSTPQNYPRSRPLLITYDGQARDSGKISEYYNNSYVIHDGYGGEANSDLDAKYSTSGKVGLVQRYITMHSFSLSAANASTDYVMSGHQAYNIKRIRDVPDAALFYSYPNFKFTKIINDSKYNSAAFKSSLTAWIKNRTGSTRPLTCSARLIISWCMWGSRQLRPQQGRQTVTQEGFLTTGGPDGGTFEGEYFKKADSYTDANGNNFGPVYQLTSTGGVLAFDGTILFNMAINKWQVGFFTIPASGTGIMWGAETFETNSNKLQDASIMPAYRWTFNPVTYPDGQYFKPAKYHGRYKSAGPVHVSGDGLGLGYLHSLYVYV